MINIRKGIFETSSSSEDSISVYQSMKLFILSEVDYKRFLAGDLYVKFDGLKPVVSDDYMYITNENEKAIKDYNIGLVNKSGLKNTANMYASNIYNWMDKLYIDYKTYCRALQLYYYEVSYFDYTEMDNVIFGFYGYTED